MSDQMEKFAEKAFKTLLTMGWVVLGISTLFHGFLSQIIFASNQQIIWNTIAAGLIIAAFACSALADKRRIHTPRFWVVSLLYVLGTLFLGLVFWGVAGLLLLLGKVVWSSFDYFKRLFQKTEKTNP